MKGSPRLYSYSKIPHQIIMLPKIILLVILILIYSEVQGQQFTTVEEKSSTELEQVRIYSNPEQRREAGFGTPLSEWLTVSGLFEIEKVFKKNRVENAQHIDMDEARSHTLQLGFEAEFSEYLKAEWVVEGEYQELLNTRFEQATIVYELESLSLELGYQELPFGEYYSHFISGPLLEFGETTASSVIVDKTVNNQFDLMAYIFDGKTRQENSDTDLGWGLGFEFFNEDESFKLGAGYISNLAESDDEILADFNNSYRIKVPAWNFNGFFGFDDFELTVEYIEAAKSFSEFEVNANKPSSFNVELAWFINPRTQIAWRIEKSRELSDEPSWQYGVAATWRVNNRLSVSAEYLKGDYKKDFATNDDDQALRDHHQFGLQMSFEF